MNEFKFGDKVEVLLGGVWVLAMFLEKERGQYLVRCEGEVFDRTIMGELIRSFARGAPK